MAPQHIVVDGSNIATEGRSTPSLKQLEDAVGELRREHPGAEVTVIVDATFAHRIDASELDRFEAAALAGEYVHPPAGAIGRGDAFLLRVAEKVDATVLSNDSFQEFHGEHAWLFERGRLLGATPVPGIGWIFSPRTPVRGPTSRQAVREADRARRDVSKAIKVATLEAVAPPGVSGPKPKIGDRRVMRQVPAASAAQRQPLLPAAVNDPLTFVSFIAEHPLGAEVTGRVDSYTSHGAVVMVGTAQCYVPLANLGSPPPRSAREVLSRGEDVTFVVRALDPQRRGVELALPGVGTVSGTPSEEMIAAEVRLARKRQPAARKAASGEPAVDTSPAEAPAPVTKGRNRKATDVAKPVAPAKAPRVAKRAEATDAAGSPVRSGRRSSATEAVVAEPAEAPAKVSTRRSAGSVPVPGASPTAPEAEAPTRRRGRVKAAPAAAEARPVAGVTPAKAKRTSKVQLAPARHAAQPSPENPTPQNAAKRARRVSKDAAKVAAPLPQKAGRTGGGTKAARPAPPSTTTAAARAPESSAPPLPPRTRTRKASGTRAAPAELRSVSPDPDTATAPPSGPRKSPRAVKKASPRR